MQQPRLREIASACGGAFRLAWLSSPRLALSQTLLAIVQALLPLAGIYALKRAVDAATAAALHASDLPAAGVFGLLKRLLHDPGSRAVAVWFVAGAAVMAAGAFLGILFAWLAEQHAIAVSDHIHGLLHRKLTEVDLAFFENTAEQNRLHLVQEQAMTRPVGVLGGLFSLIQGAVGLLGVLALLAALQPVLALVIVLAGIPPLLLRMHRSRRLYEWRRTQAPKERQASYFHRLLTAGDFAKEMRLQGHGAFCRQRFEAVREHLRTARLIWRKRVLGEELAVQIFTLVVAAVLLLWLTGQLMAGAITLGALVMYVQTIQRGQGQVGSLVAALVGIHQSSLFLTAFDELLSEQSQVAAPAEPRDVPVRIVTGVVFENVGFTYPGTDRPVLQNLSFRMRTGERIALAGVNGAGKSTVVKLLSRLYDPTSGRILVDGVDLREFDPVAWRQHVGVLFQDFGRYQLTAAENIWIGDPRGSSTDPRIAAAAREVGLDDTVRQWPQGLDTPLGRWLHDGIEPSMGQWQRLAIARAVVRDADLLIMDEPTSALDPLTQRDIFRLLEDASAGRMTLLVSHRPELLALADRIIVLCDGKVAEEGSADALRASDGEFARMFSEERAS